jgi:hypothetical protein
MPPLGRCLPDDLDSMLLPDDLVDEFFWDLDLRRALLIDIKGNGLLLGLMTGFYGFHGQIYLTKIIQ